MSNDDEDPFDLYDVVTNSAGDHSIWPQARSMPAGWTAVGTSGSRTECLSWIEANWDMSGIWSAPPSRSDAPS